MLPDLNSLLEDKQPELDAWLTTQRASRKMPIHASVDIRDAGWKAAVVDANFFPAGFNNVPLTDRPDMAALARAYLESHHGEVEHIHIYPESHTRNPGYIENLLSLAALLADAGYRVSVGSPQLNGYALLAGLSGELDVDEVSISSDDRLLVADGTPDVILLNHDLTGGRLPGLEGAVEPPVSVGWHHRRKSDHFRHLDPLVKQAASIIDIDPWLLSPLWLVSEDRCLDQEECKTLLAAQINDMISRIAVKYDEHDVQREPVIYVKNDRGTYGLGIMAITEGEQILDLSRRAMKKLTYGKGGNSAENFLIQEGVPTALSQAGAPVEPVAYTVGGERSFWFFRVNPDRDDIGNLNSPAARFLHLDQLDSELVDKVGTCAAWYELLASLSFLAMADEMSSA